MTLWRIDRKDLRALLLIAVLPLVIAAPLLFGFLNADPALSIADMTISRQGSALSGPPSGLAGATTVDGNNGQTVQALGHRAAAELIHGRMPWWNAYDGVGLPLASEYQPGAFFPPTLLLLLPQGMLLEHLLLQMLAGWGTFALLRQLGLGRLAAVTGGALFAFNGTLALWGASNILPLPFLPWMLFGIERARAKAALGLRGGWRVFAVALALGLLGGFPEEAYVNGLLALAWVGLRLIQQQPGKRLGLIWRIAAGGAAGLALAAPQIFAFFEALPVSYLGEHAGLAAQAGHKLAKATIPAIDIIPSLVAPYAMGPLFGFRDFLPTLTWYSRALAWNGIGGYVTAAILVVAAYGFVARRNLLSWLLLGWAVLAVGKMFGVQPAVFLWNLVPGAADSYIVKYIQPSWSLALILLAAFGLDALTQTQKRLRGPLVGASLVALIAVAGSVAFGVNYWRDVSAFFGPRVWTLTTLVWASLSALACVALLARPMRRWSGHALAALLMAESALMFAVPTLSNLPRGTRLDMPAVEFLRRNLNLSRYYTFGPIRPNYGAYYGIASINQVYLPNAKLWVDWIDAHLDSGADPVMFGPALRRSSNKPTAIQELNRNLPSYEWVGVKYVVAGRNETPFENEPAPLGDADRLYLALGSGQVISGALPAASSGRVNEIRAISVSVDDRQGAADGVLSVSLCNGANCASGSARIAGAHNDTMALIPLSTPLAIKAGAPTQYRFSYEGDARGIGLWAYPVLNPDASQTLTRSSGAVQGRGLKVHVIGNSTIKMVYSDAVMNIFELPNPAPYFEALSGACKVEPHGRTEAVVDCAAPSILLRRELFYPGWTAQVNGADVAITRYKDLFQAIALPRGRNTVRYRYAPPHIIWMWLLFWAAVLSLAAPLVLRPKYSRRVVKFVVRRP
jgi:hypothetical protein